MDGYLLDSNRLYRKNLVAATFSELYHANNANVNEEYDKLGQLKVFQRGILEGGNRSIAGTVARSQSWQFDALGNWNSVTTNGAEQTRTHNSENRILSVSGQTTAPLYDLNGNLTRDDQGRNYTYDEWNRLGTAWDYDALGRRIYEGGRYLYYSANWQVLEERLNGVVKTQYVWSPVYVDAMVLRDSDLNGDGDMLDTNERLYALQDANWNVTAVVDKTGGVQERYVYDPYGQVTVYNAFLNGASPYALSWVYYHQGGRLDITTGLYHFRIRDYSPTLGRWVEQDPIGLGAGDANLYRAEGNNPTSRLDPSGLEFEPLTRDRLWDIADAEGLTKGLTRGSTEYNRKVGLAFQDFALQSIGVTENKVVFHSPVAGRGVKPDGVENLTLATFKRSATVPYISFTTYRSSIFFEVKAVKSTINLSYEGNQIRGLVDVLSVSTARRAGVPPLLIFVTLDDTWIGPDVVNEATKSGVVVFQAKALYDPTCKDPDNLKVGKAKALNMAGVLATYRRPFIPLPFLVPVGSEGKPGRLVTDP